jgi:hypothetical protein
MRNLISKIRPVSRPIAGLLSIATAVVGMATAAEAHKAPAGWTYPQYCCSNQDCREVSHDAIRERPEGYVVAQTGEVLPYSDSRLKDSPDGEFHWCSAGGADAGRTICLFVPPRSY